MFEKKKKSKTWGESDLQKIGKWHMLLYISIYYAHIRTMYYISVQDSFIINNKSYK